MCNEPKYGLTQTYFCKSWPNLLKKEGIICLRKIGVIEVFFSLVNGLFEIQQIFNHCWIIFICMNNIDVFSLLLIASRIV
jgi:hypothetical protein